MKIFQLPSNLPVVSGSDSTHSLTSTHTPTQGRTGDIPHAITCDVIPLVICVPGSHV